VAYREPVEECPRTFGTLEENKRILVNESEGVCQSFSHLLWVLLWAGLLRAQGSFWHHTPLIPKVTKQPQESGIKDK